MTITFRIENGTGILPQAAAVITPDQFGALRDLLLDHAVRTDTSMIIPTTEMADEPGFELEARVCPVALASLSKCFDHDPAVIAILDEAQYLGRRVTIWHERSTGDIKMRLSLTPDSAPHLSVDEGAALALLNGLGITPDRTGVVPVAWLRDRLTTPRIRRRLDGNPELAPLVETLTAMAALKPVRGEHRIAWI